MVLNLSYLSLSHKHTGGTCKGHIRRYSGKQGHSYNQGLANVVQACRWDMVSVFSETCSKNQQIDVPGEASYDEGPFGKMAVVLSGQSLCIQWMCE